MDPEKSVLFIQSEVKEHAELHLLLSMCRILVADLLSISLHDRRVRLPPLLSGGPPPRPRSGKRKKHLWYILAPLGPTQARPVFSVPKPVFSVAKPVFKTGLGIEKTGLGYQNWAINQASFFTWVKKNWVLLFTHEKILAWVI